MDAWQVVVVGQQVVGTYDEVVVLVAINGIACYLEVDGVGAREIVVHEFHLKGIGEGNGVEDGFDVVIAVFSSADDVETEVYLCARKYDHNFYDFSVFSFSF